MRRRALVAALVAVLLCPVASAVSPPPAAAVGTPVWAQVAAGWNRSSSPTIADVDGDGTNEIVIGGEDGYLRVLRPDGSNLPGWPQPASVLGGPTAIDSTPAVADLDGDGRMEIVVGVGSTWVPNQHGGVVAFNRDGSVRWRYRTGDYFNVWTETPGADGYSDGVYSSPSIGDVNGDGFPDVVFGGWDLRIHAVDRNGVVLAGFPFWHDDSDWSSPALFDVNGDGDLEIFIGGDSTPGGPEDWRGGVFRALDATRTGVREMWKQRIGDVIASSPAIGDIDGDGRPEAVVGGGDFYHHVDGRRVWAWHLDDGSPVAGWPVDTGGATSSSPMLADLTGDDGGRPEVVIGSRDGTVRAWRGNGTPLWTTRLRFLSNPGGPVNASPITADVNGDGRLDVVVGNDWATFALDGRTGAELETYGTFWSQEASAAAGWFGAAGWRLVTAGFDTPNHTWRLASYPLPAQPGLGWPMFRQDPSHQGLFDVASSLPLFASAQVGLATVSGRGAVRVGGLTPHAGDLVTLGVAPNKPVNGLSRTSTGNGYWLVADDGGIFSFGDAAFYGSTGNVRLNQPVMGMAPTPTGRGYWMVARDGGIFSFGDAAFYGSTGSVRLNQPVVGMAPTPTGRGYWLVARDGGIFTFGDAAFYGSAGDLGQSDIVGMASSPSGRGYRFVTASGRVFCYGDAICAGDAQGTAARFVGMQTSPSGLGYWLVSTTGMVMAFGDVATTASRLAGSASPLVGVSPR